MGKITDTVKAIIIINIMIFIGCKMLGPKAFELLSIWFPENNHFHIWQVITHMFMHHPTFYLHIFFNMLGIYMFGSPLEQMWGRNKFLFFYFSCGIGAFLLPMAIDYYNFYSVIDLLMENGYNKGDIVSVLNSGQYNTRWSTILGEDKLQQFLTLFNSNSLGASGALMGLLVAFGMFFPNVGLMLIFLPIPIKAKYFIPLLLVYEIISGFIGGTSLFGVNVAHWAHVGGALTGFIMAYYWKKNSFNDHRWD